MQVHQFLESVLAHVLKIYRAGTPIEVDGNEKFRCTFSVQTQEGGR